MGALGEAEDCRSFCERQMWAMRQSGYGPIVAFVIPKCVVGRGHFLKSMRAVWVALASFCLIQAASAQTSEIRGAIEATSYEEVPANATISIRQSGSTGVSFEITRLLTEGLRERGFKFQTVKARYTLHVRLANSLDIDSSPDTALRFEKNALMVRSDRLNRKKAPPATRPRFILLRLEDLEGILIWSGQASMKQAPDKPNTLATVLVPVLVEQMFKSVDGLAVR